ncbi:MAG: AmmeMemoRadiSam system radical SAM enzyme [Actinomycetia bacterium]|nr:AmmeMemoRadiSam system radical SAM enzyme [Actinomycetes bacterium]
MSDVAVCWLCPQACRLRDGQIGRCGARQAVRGEVLSTSYGQLTALALDPIEKKPLARFQPGSQILSLGSYGCNLRCPFCQNSDISQAQPLAGQQYSPADVVALARKLQPQGNIGLAYTYNEPLINYEFVRDTARLARAAGLVNVLVSNGYVNTQPWIDLLPLLDAANIDLKAFSSSFYDLVGAPHGLATVQHNIELAAAALHLEITTLIIPGLNDSAAEMQELSAWLASVDPRIPLHLTRFHPAYQMLDRPATPRASIQELVAVAQQHLQSVYAGNM